MRKCAKIFHNMKSSPLPSAASRPSDAPGAGAQSIGRALGLLTLVGGPDEGLTLAELATRAGLTKPTAHRMLKALTQAGLVAQDKAHRYALGPEAFALGLRASTRYGLHRLAMPGLARLADLSGDAALLSVRRGDYQLCLHREEGDYPLRSQVLQAGDRHSLAIGAAGLAMLAALPPAESDAYFARNSALLSKRYPQVDQNALRRAVETARAEGHALNPGLVFPGSWALGVALCGPDGAPLAALTLAAVESRLTPARQAELVPLLRHEAEQIEAALNAPPAGRHLS